MQHIKLDLLRDKLLSPAQQPHHRGGKRHSSQQKKKRFGKHTRYDMARRGAAHHPYCDFGSPLLRAEPERAQQTEKNVDHQKHAHSHIKPFLLIHIAVVERPDLLHILHIGDIHIFQRIVAGKPLAQVRGKIARIIAVDPHKYITPGSEIETLRQQYAYHVGGRFVGGAFLRQDYASHHDGCTTEGIDIKHLAYNIRRIYRLLGRHIASTGVVEPHVRGYQRLAPGKNPVEFGRSLAVGACYAESLAYITAPVDAAAGKAMPGNPHT